MQNAITYTFLNKPFLNQNSMQCRYLINKYLQMFSFIRKFRLSKEKIALFDLSVSGA